MEAITVRKKPYSFSFRTQYWKSHEDSENSSKRHPHSYSYKLFIYIVPVVWMVFVGNKEYCCSLTSLIDTTKWSSTYCRMAGNILAQIVHACYTRCQIAGIAPISLLQFHYCTKYKCSFRYGYVWAIIV